jgi:predicted permease
VRRREPNEPKWRRYLRFWGRDPRADVEDELRFHFASRVAEFEAAGMSRSDALAAAQVRFGNVDAVRSDLQRIDARILRTSRAWQFLDTSAADLRYVLRGLRRRPGVALTVTITLAIAVGANGALFSLMDSLFFRPPAGVADPGALGRFYVARPRMADLQVNYAFSYPEYRALRVALKDEVSVAIEAVRDSTEVVSAGTAFSTGVSDATAELLPMLGVHLERGRSFSQTDDDVASPANVAVISHTLAAHLGGADAVLGQQIRVRGKDYVVVGVTAAGFDGIVLGRTSVWMPFSTMPRESPSPGEKPWYEDGSRYIPLVVRLAKDASPHAVEAHATAAFKHFLSAKPYDRNASILLGPLSTYRSPELHDSRTLIVSRTSAVAALLLIIASANVSNLFLAMAVARRREIGVRLALGISRVRLAGMMMLESLVLAAIAGLAALLLAEWAGGLLRAQLFPRIAWVHHAVGLRVIAFTGLTTLAASLAAAALPSLMAWHGTVAEAFRSGTPRATSGHRRARWTLLVVQATLSVMLIAGAMLFARTLQAAYATDLGYDHDRLVTTQVYFADRAERAQIAALMPGVAERVAGMPGVEGVAITYGAPMNQWISVPLYRADADSAHSLDGGSYYLGVSPGYFALTGTRLVDGRRFLSSDRAGAPPVIVIGETMARQIWPGQRAVGQCLRPVAPSHPCYTVVGVAVDVHEFRIQENTSEWQYYYPLDQLPLRGSDRTLVIRARKEQAEAVAASTQALLRATFPGATSRAITMNQALQGELLPWKLGLKLFGALALFALIVASVGVYGVVSFDVRQRTREIGVRMALGAAGGHVIRMLVRRSTVVVAIGVAVGINGSLAAGRYVRSLLYGVAPSDPVSLVIASTLLLLVAAAAAAVPAWCAQRIDPAIVLRDE